MVKNKQKLDVEEQIERYVNGELSEKETKDLWIELIQHEEYMDYLETTANLKGIIDDEKEAVHATKKVHVWMYAAAAVVILLLVVLGSFRMGLFTQNATVKPIQTIELDYNRSAEAANKLDSKQQVIRQAIELYNEGQFEKAVHLLNDERDQTEDLNWISELDITLGALYYDNDKFNDAIFYFKDVISNKKRVKPLKLEKAYWYLGNAYFQMNMIEEAKAAMQKAYELNGAYSRVAKSYLDAMADARTPQP